MSDPRHNNTVQEQFAERRREIEVQLLPPSPETSASQSNVDGSARVYRFPAELPPRFQDATNLMTEERVVTVRNLRNKTCWICSEDEEDSPQAARGKRFVHPCRCTLIAHESCLLAWIDQSKLNHPLQETVSCPQCKAPYVLLKDQSYLLGLFDSIDKVVTRIIPIGSAATVGGALLVASTAYGCVAMRMMLGKEAARRTLSSPWPWHYWFDIPLIPFALVAARFRIFDSAITLVPTIVAFPLTSTHLRLLDRYLDHRVVNARSYPPGPALTAVLAPWARVFYLAIKRRVYRAVLSPFLKKPRRSTTPASGQRRRTRVIVVGNGNNQLMDGDPPPGVEAMHDGLPDGEVEDTGDGNVLPQTVYISHQSLGRLCLGALGLPFVANWMGHLLALLSKRLPTLSRLLGIQPNRSSVFSSYYTTKTATASPSPLSSLFRGNLPSFTDATDDPSPTTYDDLDPVWFRNAIGAGLFILVKDVAGLVYKYLKLKQRKQTRILDLPFQSSLVGGLDLCN